MRHNERATPKTVKRPADPSEIRPKLRFLLSDEARKEGKMMVRNFGGYTLSRPADDTRSQFSAIARQIKEGRYPNIAAADSLMGGVLIQSVEKIAGGFRQPEWMLWHQSWANALANGWPSMMEGAAKRMMTRDERFLPRMIDDETAMLPSTTVDAVRAGGGAYARGSADWTPSREVAVFRRYREFVSYLEDSADGDDTIRVVEDPRVTKNYSVYLALESGQNGGVAVIVARKGITPAARAGTTVALDPTTSKIALAAAMSTERMMELGRLILTPGAADPAAVIEFTAGLSGLQKTPYDANSGSASRPAPATKPPSLDDELWDRIPRDKRREYIRAMALGLRRGVHPDHTVEELLAAAA
ncbi:hypothetical protein [Rhizobium sp. TRM95796]|uniref:hypothetical protein n=1 Tax=Rhizobium sp. TRM95796 TaxID=2979862 RepID=UPI0021E7832B|nr:hypothetical protein [Rhizobium sp. TRM95796]MCV3768900.1 hypothetical protein [Rhizobium sp. TRM95796]